MLHHREAGCLIGFPFWCTGATITLEYYPKSVIRPRAGMPLFMA